MIMLKAHERKSFVFMAEPCDVGADGPELQHLKARTVRGVSQVDQSSGCTIIHIQALGRGPLACEQQLKEALNG